MSFLIDPPWLYANGLAYGTLAPERAKRPPVSTAAAAATIAVFWGVGGALYRDRRWTRPLWRAFPSEDGRDFMINSGVLNLDHRSDPRRADALSAMAFATYPLWLWLGYRHGRRRG